MRDFLTEMLYALTSAYTRKDYDNRKRGSPPETNIGKLFSVFAWGLDTVREQTELIRLWDNIDNARGTVLDRYGANFGVQRYGADDSYYRLTIKVKVLSQLSGGDTDTVIEAASALLGVDVSDIVFEDVFPAKVALYVDIELLSQNCRELIEPIAYDIKRILAAGVGMRLYLRTYRTYRSDMMLLQCGYAYTQVLAVPVSQNRESIGEWNVNCGGFTVAAFAPPPFGNDRTTAMSVLTTRGAVQAPNMLSFPPAPHRAHTGHQDRAGGVIYQTHIKSERID